MKTVKITDKQKEIIELMRKYDPIVMSDGWFTGGHGVKVNMGSVNALQRLKLIGSDRRLTELGKTVNLQSLIKYFTILIILLSSYTTNAQLTRDEDRNSYFVAGFHAGSDFKHVISGLQLGYRIGNVYLSANSFFPVTSYALTPKMVTFLGGYNIGCIQPFIGSSYQTVGRESEQFYRGKENEFINGWRMVYGLAYYPINIPVCFSLQKQGKEIISSLTLYKSL